MNIPIKRGMVIRHQGHLFNVVELEERHSGKTRPKVHVMLRDVLDGHPVDRNLEDLEPIDEVATFHRSAQYLYPRGAARVFMDSESFEEFELRAGQLAGAEPFLREGDTYRMLYADAQPLRLELPENVPLRVKMTAAPEHAVGATASVLKEATLENDLVIRVPLFIKSGDLIRVDTRTRAYAGKDKGS